MEPEQALEDMGLGPGEAKTYLALLKLGLSPVNKIKEETGLHRTTIYDFLEKLINKGLASQITRKGVNHYQATDPSRLLEYLREKEDAVKHVLPELIKLSQSRREDLRVEVIKGIEGFKALTNDILRTGKDYVSFGVEEIMFKETYPFWISQYFKKEKKLGIRSRLLASENTKYIFDSKTWEYRFIPEEFFSPTNTLIYGNKVAISTWNPIATIIIESKELADSYMKYFDLLWSIAKDKPKGRLKKMKP